MEYIDRARKLINKAEESALSYLTMQNSSNPEEHSQRLLAMAECKGWLLEKATRLLQKDINYFGYVVRLAGPGFDGKSHLAGSIFVLAFSLPLESITSSDYRDPSSAKPLQVLSGKYPPYLLIDDEQIDRAFPGLDVSLRRRLVWMANLRFSLTNRIATRRVFPKKSREKIEELVRLYNEGYWEARTPSRQPV